VTPPSERYQARPLEKGGSENTPQEVGVLRSVSWGGEKYEEAKRGVGLIILGAATKGGPGRNVPCHPTGLERTERKTCMPARGGFGQEVGGGQRDPPAPHIKSRTSRRIIFGAVSMSGKVVKRGGRAKPPSWVIARGRGGRQKGSFSSLILKTSQ